MSFATSLFRRNLFVVSLLIIGIAAGAHAADFNRIEWSGGYSRSRVKSNVEEITFTTPGGGTDGFTDLCSAATGEHLGTDSQRFFCKGRGFNGANVSFTYNLSRYVGIKTDLAAYTKSETFVDDFGGIIQTIDVDEHLQTLLTGVQLKDNGSGAGRWRPFGHALAGFARYTNRQSQDIDAFPMFNFTAKDRETSLALKIGGGLDVSLTPRVDLRLIEIDYQPIFAGDRNMKTVSGPFTFHLKGKTAANTVIGFGIVIH